MSEFELFFRIEGSEYGDGAMLNKHGDRYSIVAAHESKNGGTVYMDWAFPQDKERKPKAKAVPMGVRTGNLTQTIGILKSMLAALEKPANAAPSAPKTQQEDDDIPF